MGEGRAGRAAAVLRAERPAALRALATALLLAVLLFAVPVLTNAYWVLVLTATAVYSIVALGLALLVGRVGMISLGQIALLAVGGWIPPRLGLAPHMAVPLLLLATRPIPGVVRTLIVLPAPPP